MSETQRAMDYLKSFGIQSEEVVTTTEWGVEMTATIIGRKVTKIFMWRNADEAVGAVAAYRNNLAFVHSARVVSREVTTTSWKPHA